jgi:hypothetical protein
MAQGSPGDDKLQYLFLSLSLSSPIILTASIHFLKETFNGGTETVGNKRLGPLIYQSAGRILYIPAEQGTKKSLVKQKAKDHAVKKHMPQKFTKHM